MTSIGKFFRVLGTLFTWFCVGTILAEVLIVIYFAWEWKIDSQRLQTMIRVARGELPAPSPSQDLQLEKAELLLREDPSYEEFLAQRARASRDLELREMQLRTAEKLLQAQLEKLLTDKTTLARSQEEFQKKLAEAQDQAKAAAMETVRGILESLRPDQAKAQLRAMADRGQWDEAVAILTEMPASKRGRILAEFKSPEEQALLGQLLEKIRSKGSTETQTASGPGAGPQPPGG
jgi:flagellar motility protein MotE (MotC chaperone)